MIAVRWILDHWWLPVVVVLAAVVLILSGKDEGREILDAELEAIDAKRQGRELEARMGLERAIATVDASHAATIKELDAETANKIIRFRRSPARYNAELAKLGRQLRYRRKVRGG